MVSLPVCHLLLVEIERNQSSPPWSNELASPGFFHDTGVAKWKRQSEIKTILQKVNLKSQDQNWGVRTLSKRALESGKEDDAYPSLFKRTNSDDLSNN